MLTSLTQKLAANGGVVRRSEALDCGVAPYGIAQLLKAGDLVVLSRGVYADGELWRSLDDYRGRPMLQVRASLMSMQRGWVLSHDSAALEVGMPLLDPVASLVHVTRPGYTSAWTRAGVKRHYARFRPSQLCTTDEGVRHLSIARTAVDMAREHGESAGVMACDWALRQGVPRHELLEASADMAFWPGVVGVRSSADIADPRAENGAESLARLMLIQLAMGEVDVQFPMQLRRQVAWGDLRIGNHIFEVHGKIKLTPAERGGVATKPPEDVVMDQMRRAREIRELDLGVSDIFYADLFGERRREAKERLAAELAVTNRRFGPDLHPHLAADAERLRAIHGRRDRAA